MLVPCWHPLSVTLFKKELSEEGFQLATFTVYCHAVLIAIVQGDRDRNCEHFSNDIIHTIKRFRG